MKVKGVEIQDAAILAELKKRTERPFTTIGVEEMIRDRLTQPPGLSASDWSRWLISGPMRAADRLIQKHRKSGDIVQGTRRGLWLWSLSED